MATETSADYLHVRWRAAFCSSSWPMRLTRFLVLSNALARIFIHLDKKLLLNFKFMVAKLTLANSLKFIWYRYRRWILHSGLPLRAQNVFSVSESNLLLGIGGGDGEEGISKRHQPGTVRGDTRPAGASTALDIAEENGSVWRVLRDFVPAQERQLLESLAGWFSGMDDSALLVRPVDEDGWLGRKPAGAGMWPYPNK